MVTRGNAARVHFLQQIQAGPQILFFVFSDSQSQSAGLLESAGNLKSSLRSSILRGLLPFDERFRLTHEAAAEESKRGGELHGRLKTCAEASSPGFLVPYPLHKIMHHVRRHPLS
jgi:hypothetical protein